MRINKLLIADSLLTNEDVSKIINVKNNLTGKCSNPAVRFFLLLAWLSISSVINLLVNEVLKLSINESLFFLFNVALLYILYSYYVYKIEKRKPLELSLSFSIPEFLKGSGVGFLLLSLSLIILFATGYYYVVSYNNIGIFLLEGFINDIHFAFLEELLFRIIIFRLLEEAFGSKISLFVTSLFFGAAHFFNPGATLITSIAITLEAGLLLGAAYLTTRRIWYPLGIHFGWNYLQGNIFGINVSGNTRLHSLVTIQANGPSYMTGGEFGIEGSFVALIVCIIFSFYLLNKFYSLKRSSINRK